MSHSIEHRITAQSRVQTIVQLQARPGIRIIVRRFEAKVPTGQPVVFDLARQYGNGNFHALQQRPCLIRSQFRPPAPRTTCALLEWTTMPESTLIWSPEASPGFNRLLVIAGHQRLAVRARTFNPRRRENPVWIKLTYDVEKAT